MTREEFRSQCEEYVDYDYPLRLANVLDRAYARTIQYEKPKFLERKINGRVLRTLVWFEVIFFLDPETDNEEDEIFFYGVKTQSLNMQSGGEILEFPVIPIDNPIGESQTLDWDRVFDICDTFNSNLRYPVGITMVRMATDESRTTSLYYPLKQQVKR